MFMIVNVMLLFIGSSCKIKAKLQPSLGLVDYFDKDYEFKNNFQISVSKDGYSFTFKNISNQTVYMNTVLSEFSSDKFISLYNDVDLTYQQPIIISSVKINSTISFNCTEFVNNSNKAQILALFWIYDFKEFSKGFTKIEEVGSNSYKIKSSDFQKVRGMAFVEIDKISFCQETKYKIKLQKY